VPVPNSSVLDCYLCVFDLLPRCQADGLIVVEHGKLHGTSGQS
jgi:hypothetical protein